MMKLILGVTFIFADILPPIDALENFGSLAANKTRGSAGDKSKIPPVSKDDYLVVRGRSAGMFSVCDDILALLKYYEKGDFKGLKINFAKQGLYYSPDHGDNWWNYYFELAQFGKKGNVRYFESSYPLTSTYEIEYRTSRREANRLINKYIKVRPEIMEKVERFQALNFDGYYVVTVHYRGTDKKSEAPPVGYTALAEKVEEVLRQCGCSRFKIFIATDEQKFLDFMIHRYGHLVCYNTEAVRSDDKKALHYSHHDRYQVGLDAVIDAILLSRGNYLIRMSSNLSRWSTYFNPDIPVYELNQRKNDASLRSQWGSPKKL